MLRHDDTLLSPFHRIKATTALVLILLVTLPLIVMSIHALPVELLVLIAELLPDTSLPALARTSSHFRPVAQRVLYRHLVTCAWSRNLSLVPLLARSPHLARYVRSFFIALDSQSPIFRPFYDMLAKALRNMSDLHSLHLRVDVSASWVLRDTPAYPNLAHFTSTFAFDQHVVRFLQNAPSLLELEVDALPIILPRTSPIPALPESSIPHLEQFTGPSRVASVIVPGRPVRSIHLNDTCPAEDDIPMLARSTAPVLMLDAVTNASPVSFLHLLHHHLPHLAYLRVMSTQNLFQPPTAEFYEQVANALDSFSKLDAFELCGMHWGSLRKRDDESKRVWQSSPLSSSPLPTEDSDLLFGVYAY